MSKRILYNSNCTRAGIAITLETVNYGKSALCVDYRIRMGYVACALTKGHISKSGNQNPVCSPDQSGDCDGGCSIARRHSRTNFCNVLANGSRWHDLGSWRTVRV